MFVSFRVGVFCFRTKDKLYWNFSIFDPIQFTLSSFGGWLPRWCADVIVHRRWQIHVNRVLVSFFVANIARMKRSNETSANLSGAVLHWVQNDPTNKHGEWKFKTKNGSRFCVRSDYSASTAFWLILINLSWSVSWKLIEHLKMLRRHSRISANEFDQELIWSFYAQFLLTQRIWSYLFRNLSTKKCHHIIIWRIWPIGDWYIFIWLTSMKMNQRATKLNSLYYSRGGVCLKWS